MISLNFLRMDVWKFGKNNYQIIFTKLQLENKQEKINGGTSIIL